LVSPSIVWLARCLLMDVILRAQVVNNDCMKGTRGNICAVAMYSGLTIAAPTTLPAGAACINVAGECVCSVCVLAYALLFVLMLFQRCSQGHNHCSWLPKKGWLGSQVSAYACSIRGEFGSELWSASLSSTYLLCCLQLSTCISGHRQRQG
jgi:hypothetical protein